MGNNKHIDELIKGKLQSYKISPSPDLWSRIENELDYKENISNHNRYIKLAAVFILILSFISTNSILKNTSSSIASPDLAFSIPPTKDQLPETITTAAIQRNNTPNNNHSARIESNQHFVSDTSTTSSIALIETKILHKDTSPEIQIEKSSLSGANNERINGDQSPVEFAFAKIISADKNDDLKPNYDIELDTRNSTMNLRGFSIGICASYNQSSVLENSNIFRGDRSIQTSLKFGTSKGISFNYNFTNHLGIQADYIYNAVEGQNYILSENNQIIQKTLSLYYNEIPVLVKYKVGRISDITDRPIVLNYIAGIQYGKLNEYRIPQEKRFDNDEPIFNKNALSFIIGLDYDIFLGDNLYISLGARGALSNDISSHISPLDTYAKRNFVFGLRGSLNYTFGAY